VSSDNEEDGREKETYKALHAKTTGTSPKNAKRNCT